MKSKPIEAHEGAAKEKYAAFRGAKIVKVIRLEINEGEGKDNDPMRRVVYWLDFDGNIIAHNDPADRKFRGEP